MKFAALLAATVVFAAAPAFAQTVGPCPAGVGSAPQSQPAWVLFDLGKADLRPEAKPAIAKAAQSAKDRQATTVCVIGQTDKLGDKNFNAKLAQARSQAVASELIKNGLPGNKVVIASNPEAFGNLSLGGADAQERDRRVTIVFR
jgi:outer membrane protein OmpA-like peptidoglycan-associated protein